MYTVAKIFERDLETLGTYEKKEDAVSVLEEDFKKEFKKVFDEEYWEGAEGHFWFEPGYEYAWLDNGYMLDWKILDCRLNFYYTFGSAEFYPFQNGWIVVKADSRAQADRIFKKHFPCRTPHVLNCADVYNESEWRKMAPEMNWKGNRCHGIYEK